MHRRSSLFWRVFRVFEGVLVLASAVLLVFVIVLAIESWRAPWRDPRHMAWVGNSFTYFSKVQDQGTFEAGTFIVCPVQPQTKYLWEPRLGPVSLGFSCSNGFLAGYVIMPFWTAAVLGGLGPAYVVVRLLTRRKPRAWECPACAYDLTGNTSGVCPECGVPIPGRTPTSGRDGDAGHDCETDRDGDADTEH
jgi:hypothetical protein